MRLRLASWSISLLIVIVWIMAAIKNPDSGRFPHHFFLIKYALDILFVNGAILFFVMPILMENAIINSNLHEEDEFAKAKSFLVVSTIISPGFLLVFIATWLTKEGHIPFSLIFLYFFCGYLKNSYVYYINKRPPS